MSHWTRREILESGSFPAAAGALLNPPLSHSQTPPPRTDEKAAPASSAALGPREHLLLDFGWRFRSVTPADPDRDLGYGRGRMFAKSGQLFAAFRRRFRRRGLARAGPAPRLGGRAAVRRERPSSSPASSRSAARIRRRASAGTGARSTCRRPTPGRRIAIVLRRRLPRRAWSR